MKKLELIKSLNAWDFDTNVVIFSKSTGQYKEIKQISRGLGKGIILEVE